MNVVSIKSRAALGAKAHHRQGSSRPRVLIIDRPKTCLLVVTLLAVAVGVAGALVNDLLSAPRGLVCDAPSIAAAE
jgi:hypothetical protein